MSDPLLLLGERYFLTPVCLVPNGRAHLGHIGGPLLRMDVARRHLLRAGATALAINTSDSHESHVAVQAYRESATPEAVARSYHEQIHDDLRALEIEWDDFIDPLDEEWYDIYTSVVTGLVERIIAAGNAGPRLSEVPVLTTEADACGQGSADSHRPRAGEAVVSGWLRGTCPGCGDGLTGFFCERCGGYFEPGEMLNPATAHFEGEIELRQRTSLYLHHPLAPDEILDELARKAITPSFRAVMAGHLARSGPSIRLTVPSRWGIPWRDRALDPGEVIWSYSALLIGCHLTAGERFGQLAGTGNPFLADSGVTCVISFGIDNTIPYLLGAQGCLHAQDTYKPVDAFLTNHFALLNGQKFSTSRRHVIWGGDLVRRGGANPDLSRLLLCLNNPEFARVDFDTSQFQSDYARLAYRLSMTIADAFVRAGESSREHNLDASIVRALEAEAMCQSAHLDFHSFNLNAAAGTVIRWLDAAERLQQDAASALSWLFGLALLAAPFMPSLARRLWSDLNQDGVPRLLGRVSRRPMMVAQTCLSGLEPLEAMRFEQSLLPSEQDTALLTGATG